MAVQPGTNGGPDGGGQLLVDKHDDLLRLATAGSVDDGKSTLIGRLLYDSKAIFADQLEHIEEVSRRRGDGYVDLALLTDGLRAEREQGITIDVAYRFFATPRRTFIIADTPGHERYTRNMVTGASTADLSIVLVDARKGVVEQSRRHAFIASLLRIPHLVVCVNKMDLVDYSHKRFQQIEDEVRAFAARLEVADVTLIPISALKGDNVVDRSTNMPWYEGPPLLYHLEHVHVAADRNLVDVRFPVQYVIRPRDAAHHDYRGYAGQVAGGVLRAGDEVVVLPAGTRSRIAAIDGPEGEVGEAFPPMSVTVRLEHEVDVSRGDVMARVHNRPAVTTALEAHMCWMTERPLQEGNRYLVKHTTRTVRARVAEVVHRIEINGASRHHDATELHLNDIGKVGLSLASPLMVDTYARNRITGSFILVDEATNETVGAGMVAAVGRGAPPVELEPRRSPDVVWDEGKLNRERRWAALGVQGATVWFTGLPSSGKSTIAAAVEARLVAAGVPAYRIDGDNLRHGLSGDLGFDADARAENVRRAAEVAKLMADSGTVALVSLVSPYAVDRDRARAIHAGDDLAFVEVFVDTPIEECERRDPKGLYAKARAGEISGFTGVDDPYEPPRRPDVRVTSETVDEAVEKVLAALGRS
ncbi:MAG: adenylyl-sulfate kinase [Solirubrobacteraceae bacterium]